MGTTSTPAGAARRSGAATTWWLALVLGAAVGVLAGVYLEVVHRLTDVVWDGTDPRWFPDLPGGTVLVCVIGGVLVGLLQLRHAKDTPHDLEDALTAVDEELSPDKPRLKSPIWILRVGVIGIVGLAFGASLGPEAPLMLIAVGFGQRIARILRMAREEAALVTTTASLAGLFGGPFGALALPLERRRTIEARLLGPGLLAGASGFLTMLLVLPGNGGLRYELPGDDADLAGHVGWAAVGALPATAAGLLLLLGMEPARRLGARIPHVVARATVGGLVLGGCALLQPWTLFSGQTTAQDLIDGARGLGAGTLLALVALNIVATLACIGTGWVGGQIFPALFTGMAAALLVLVAWPDAPLAALIAGGAAAGTTAVLRRPLAAALLLLLFFPPDEVAALLVGVGVAAAALSVLGSRLPARHEMLH